MNKNKENSKEQVLKESSRKGMIQISGFKENEAEVWVFSKEWFHPVIIEEENVSTGYESDIKVLERFINEWKSRAKELEKSYRPAWRVKGASIRFLYHDKMYQLFPSAIGTNSELFEHMAKEIEQGLKEIGCPFVRYEGTLD